MKNQYFGDRRDLFKYDLLLDLIEAHGFGNLTLVPMLTPDDGSGEGRLTQANCGGRRRALYDFFKTSIESHQQDIRRLHKIMPMYGVDFKAFRDGVWFEHEHSAEYFDAVPSKYLTQSVVFVDPDIGLETGSPSYMRKQGLEKYLLYSDLVSIWKRFSPNSVVVVYQHLQKDARKRAGDVERRVRDLQIRLKSSAWAIQWNYLAFVAATRDVDVADRIREAMQSHADRHELSFYEVAT